MPAIKTEEDNFSIRFSYSELLKKAQKFCIYQERAVYQIEKKLNEWGASIETTEKIINNLKREDYINEERFVSLFVNSKLKHNKWGKNKIVTALHFYRIDEDIISKFAEFVDNELYIKVLAELIEKKLRELQKEKDVYLRNYKILNYCKSKGFETDLINRILNK